MSRRGGRDACSYAVYDTDLVVLARNAARAKAMSVARREWAQLVRSGEAGRPGRGTHGMPQSVSVIETCGRRQRELWRNGRLVAPERWHSTLPRR